VKERDRDSCESDMTVYISFLAETFIARNCALYSPATDELSAPARYSRTYYSSGDACNEHDSAVEHKIAKFRSIAFHVIQHSLPGLPVIFPDCGSRPGPIALRLGGIQGEFYLLLPFNKQLAW